MKVTILQCTIYFFHKGNSNNIAKSINNFSIDIEKPSIVSFLHSFTVSRYSSVPLHPDLPQPDKMSNEMAHFKDVLTRW